MKSKKAFIWVDGASRGNPGPAAIGVIIKDEKDETHARIFRRIGITTNNQAEYKALIAALEKAVSLGAETISIHSDSQLMVRQLTGRYRVRKEELKPLFQHAVRLLSSVKEFTITHIPREQNAEADALANKALDSVD